MRVSDFTFALPFAGEAAEGPAAGEHEQKGQETDFEGFGQCVVGFVTHHKKCEETFGKQRV